MSCYKKFLSRTATDDTCTWWMSSGVIQTAYQASKCVLAALVTICWLFMTHTMHRNCMRIASIGAFQSVQCNGSTQV